MRVTEVKHAAKRQEWQERILECRSSGETVQGWCAERQLCVSTYYRWEREIFGKLEKKRKENLALEEAAPEFTEVRGTAHNAEPDRAVMTIRAGEMAVDIYAGAAEAEIQAICRILKQC